MDKKIVIASSNAGKIMEISKYLNEQSEVTVQILSLQDFNIVEPDEPYQDFIQNAVHKAKYYAKYTQEMVLSDDSGLCIEALNGFPGVNSKKFIEECGGNVNAFLKLEEMLKPFANHSAYFCSAIAIYEPVYGKLITHEEKEMGTLIFPSRGNQGFGYDPIFMPEGHYKTFAELGLDQKNKMSHRAKALQGIFEKLRQI